MNGTPQMIYPCVFGTSAGFELQVFQELPFKVRDLLVALTRSEVELGWEDTCIKVLRIRANGQAYTWIGHYRKAYEMGFSREGGYYGAGVWLPDITVNGRYAVELLDTLSRQVNRLALESGKFRRTIASTLPELDEMSSVKLAMRTLLGSQRPHIRGGLNVDAKGCAFICRPTAFADLIEWAQTDVIAQNFSSIIIAPASAFPKAGASSNITQYLDLADLERALDKDYSARIAKLQEQNAKTDAQSKDWQKRTQLLEVEISERKEEIQSLKQRIALLETPSQRARPATMLGRQLQPTGAPTSMDGEGDLSSPWIVAPLSIAISVLATSLVFWFFAPSSPQPQEDVAAHIQAPPASDIPQIDPSTSSENQKSPGQENSKKVPTAPAQNKPTQTEQASTTDTNSETPMDNDARSATTDGQSPSTPEAGYDRDAMQQKLEVVQDPSLSPVQQSDDLSKDQRRVLLACGEGTICPVKDLSNDSEVNDHLDDVLKQLQSKGLIDQKNYEWRLTEKGFKAFQRERAAP